MHDASVNNRKRLAESPRKARRSGSDALHADLVIADEDPRLAYLAWAAHRAEIADGTLGAADCRAAMGQVEGFRIVSPRVTALAGPNFPSKTEKNVLMPCVTCLALDPVDRHQIGMRTRRLRRRRRAPRASKFRVGAIGLSEEVVLQRGPHSVGWEMMWLQG